MSKNFLFKNSVYAIAILVLVLFFLAETGCSNQGHQTKMSSNGSIISTAGDKLLPGGSIIRS